MKALVILGVGGYCSNLLDIVSDMNRAASEEIYRPIGFLDDDPARQGTLYCGLPVLGQIASAAVHGDAWFVNGIGSAETFRRKHAIIASAGVAAERFATLVHPSAFVAPSARIAAGSVIAQQSVVMSGALIGRHVKTLPHATISYGVEIGDFGTIASGVVLLSEVAIGASCYLGANVAIRERCRVGPRSLIGMGTVVIDDLPADVLAVGNPARIVRRFEEENVA